MVVHLREIVVNPLCKAALETTEIREYIERIEKYRRYVDAKKGKKTKTFYWNYYQSAAAWSYRWIT